MIATKVPNGTAPDDPAPMRKKLRRKRQVNMALRGISRQNAQVELEEASTHVGKSMAVMAMFLRYSSPRSVAKRREEMYPAMIFSSKISAESPVT